jgi:hypothetical protein
MADPLQQRQQQNNKNMSNKNSAGGIYMSYWFTNITSNNEKTPKYQRANGSVCKEQHKHQAAA